MKTITIEELEQLTPGSVTIVDVRPADTYQRGTFEGAINVPMKEFVDRYEEIPKDKPVWVLCHTGERSLDYVELLCSHGYDAGNITGGYRAYLRLQLERFMKEEDARKEKTKEIERSLIKKFRKSIWRSFTRAIQKYDLIQEGDKIAVCISGGKDSMLMAKLMQELQRHGKFPFELVFLVMNPGYNEDNWKIIQDNAKLLDIPLTVFESDIFNIVAEVDRNPCYLCARMRRGYLYSHAKELGCNKIALGHHFSDVIETTVMGLFYGGQLQAMPPKLRSKNFPGMELIRPLYCVHEDAIIAWKNYNHLQFLQCACRFTEEREAAGDGVGRSKRQEIKFLLRELKKTNPNIEKSIFQGINGLQLDTFPGFKHRGVFHSFPELYNHPDWFAGETKTEEISEELRKCQ